MFKFDPYTPGQIDLGFIQIRFYAICILLGGLAALWVSRNSLAKRGYAKEKIDQIFMAAFPSGIIGARIWYVIAQWNREFFWHDFLQVFNFSGGGLAIQGGVVMGIAVGIIAFFIVFKDKALLIAADYAVVTILLAQSIGRLGNFFNHEVYGRCVSRGSIPLPSFIVDNIAYPGVCGAGQQAVPLFLIEGLANLSMFFILHLLVRKYWTRTKYHRNGDFVAFYFVWYGILRAVLEPLRNPDFIMGDASKALPISVLTSLAFIMIGVLIFLMLRRKSLFRFKAKVVLFDLDGTLLNNNQFIIDCYRHLFATFRPDFVPTPAQEISFLGPRPAVVFNDYFDQDYRTLIDEYRRFGQTIRDRISLFDSAREVLAELKSKGVIVGLVTTKNTKVAHADLAEQGIEGYFDVVIGASDVKRVKPSPQGINRALRAINKGRPLNKRIWRHRVLMVGDSQSDILAAKRALVAAVGVDWSPKVDQLLEVTPDITISSLTQILKMVKPC